MKKILLVLSIVLVCSTVLVGCSLFKKEEKKTTPKKEQLWIDNELVGTWDDSLLPVDQQLGCYWTFEKNGTGVNGLFDETFKYAAGMGQIHIKYDSGLGEYDYTYVIEGDIITLTEVTEETQIPYKYKKTK